MILTTHLHHTVVDGWADFLVRVVCADVNRNFAPKIVQQCVFSREVHKSINNYACATGKVVVYERKCVSCVTEILSSATHMYMLKTSMITLVNKNFFFSKIKENQWFNPLFSWKLAHFKSWSNKKRNKSRRKQGKWKKIKQRKKKEKRGRKERKEEKKRKRKKDIHTESNKILNI